MINSTNIAYLINKAEDILKRKEVSLTLSNIAKDYYTQKLYRRYSLETWMGKDIFKEKITSETLVLTAYSLELAGIKLISAGKLHPSHQILSYAAKIFEYVGTYLDLPRSYRTNLLRHAAVCYDAGGFPCNSIVMANRVLEDLESIKEPMETIPRFLFLVNLLIYSFLARKFTHIKTLYKTIMAEKSGVQDVIQSIETDQEQAKEIIRLIGFLEASEAIHDFYQFLITGESSLKNSVEVLEKGIQIFLDANDSENFALTTLLSVIMKEIQKRSVWISIKKYFEGYPEYIEQLVNSDPPIVELWTSQINAIDSGLLDKDKKNFVISMPTSAGKTLIAEFAIMKSLNENQNSTCIYIAPNKALALQVERDLMKRIAPLGFKVSLVVGSYDYPEIEALKLENCRVLVTTPEKLSLLLKRKHPVVMNCLLFVLDEAQTLQTGGDRGIHIEFLLIRIRKLLPTSQIILLSAVINNPEEISSWLEEGTTQAVSIDWHPTRTLQAVLHDGVVEYFDEIPGLKLEFPEAKRKSNQDKAVILAKAYQSLGPVLIFCNTKSRAEEIAKRLNEKLFIPPSPSSFKRLKELANRVRAQFGSGFALSKYVEKGIAYHHADLPSEIRSEIEELVRKGDIRLITSTTTLAEGINTPVSTVIIPYLNFLEFSLKDGWKWTPLSKMLYKNIAGRAGRALENTEGHVVLLKPGTKPLSETTKYLKSSRKELEPVESALKKLVVSDEFTQIIDFNDKNVLAYQTEILSIICDKIPQTDEAQSFIDLTFFGHHVSRESKEYHRLLIHTSMHLEHLHKMRILTHSSPYSPTNIGTIYNETGLSPESCELLLEEIELLKKRRKNFKIPIDPKRPQLHNWLLDLLNLVFIPLEVRSSDTYKQYLPNAKILLDWIFGKSVIQIAKEYFKEKSFDKSVLKAFAYSYVQLSYYAPWVLWAITKLLDFKGIEYSWPVRILPAFAKYGTNDIVAVYCSALGISSRRAARILAETYRKDEREISFESFMKWLHSLNRKDISAIIDERNMQELVYLDIEKSKGYISSLS